MGIEIVSASAGSGKTHRLAEILALAVEGGHVRPEAVVATTFTNRAAAELMERVRSASSTQGGSTRQEDSVPRESGR